MERKLPIVILILGILLALMVPIFIVVNSLYGKKQTKPTTVARPSYPKGALPSDLGEFFATPTPTGVQKKEETKPVATKFFRGSYQSFNDGVLTVNPGGRPIEARMDTDTNTVCVPRFWPTADGGKYDITTAWTDMSFTNMDNYKTSAKNETKVSFSEYFPKLTSDDHLMVFALQSQDGKTLFAKKLWIVGCAGTK
jgi:hypothetical protein